MAVAGRVYRYLRHILPLTLDLVALCCHGS